MRSARRLDHKRTIRRNQKFQAVLGCMLGAAASVSGQSMLMSPPSVSTTPPSVEDGMSDHAGFLGTGSLVNKLTSPLSLLQWGPISGRPHFLYSMTYGDGLNSTPGKKTTSVIHQFFPGITFIGGTHWTLDYSPSLTYYSSKNLRDTLNQSVALNGAFSYEDWNFMLNQGYNVSGDPNIETGTQTDVETYSTMLGASYRFNSKFSIDSTITQNFNYADQLNSTKSWALTEYLNYQFAPRLTVGVGTTLGYDEASLGPDATSEQLLGRIQWRASDKISLNLHAGAEDRQYQGGGLPSSITPVFGAGIDYQMAEQTYIGLTAERSVSPALLTSASSTSTTVAVSATQRLLGKLNLFSSISYTSREYSGTTQATAASGSRSDSYYTFNARLSYPLGSHITVAGTYQYSKNSSSAAGLSYDSTQFGIQAGYNF